MGRKIYDDDDGRTVADMSGIDGGFSNPFGKKKKPAQDPDQTKNLHHEPIMNKKEEFWYIMGALKAALLIGGAFIVGLGLVILLILLAGK